MSQTSNILSWSPRDRKIMKYSCVDKPSDSY